MRDVNEAPVREVEGGGHVEQRAFTIKADQKMFRILINGLYADKPRAIVRELWSNHFDSHAQAGIPTRPFECHLPTRFAPHYSSRDFGVSMSHEQVMTQFSTVGESSKEMTNLAVGKFGLGSKTPFAYTDQFSLTCWLDGVKRIYNAFIDAGGIPTIALFHQEDSDEETGVEVSFPIQPRDAESFLRAAKTTLLGFDVVPVLTGAQIDVEKDLGTVVQSGEGWVLRRGEYGSFGNHAHVKQGCVVYPLDRGALDTALRSEKGLSYLIDSGLIFEVPIGSVDITPSRESLSYEATTIANIVERLKAIREEIIAPFASAISNTMKLRDAMAAYTKLFEGVGSVLPRPMVDDLKKIVTWRGKKVESLFANWHASVGKARVKVIVVEALGYRGSSGRVSGCPRTFNEAFCTGSIYRNWTDPAPIFVLQTPGERVPYAGPRVANLVRERRQTVYWVQGGRSELARLLVLFRRPEKHEVFNLADLANPLGTTSAGPREKGKVKMRRFVNGGWKDEKVAVDAGGLAFFQEDGRIWDKYSRQSLSDANAAATVVDLLIASGAIENDDSIYLVPTRCRKSVMKHAAAWDCALTYAKEAAEQGWTQDDEDTEAGANKTRSVADDIDNMPRELFNHAKRIGITLTLNRPAAALSEKIESLAGAATKLVLSPGKVASRKLCRTLGVQRSGTVSPAVSAIEQEVLDCQKAFHAAYPMVRRINRWHMDREDAIACLDYIALVDAAALQGVAAAPAQTQALAAAANADDEEEEDVEEDDIILDDAA